MDLNHLRQRKSSVPSCLVIECLSGSNVFAWLNMANENSTRFYPRFRKKNPAAKYRAVEDAWKDSKERKAVLNNMSLSERKRRRYE